MDGDRREAHFILFRGQSVLDSNSIYGDEIGEALEREWEPNYAVQFEHLDDIYSEQKNNEWNITAETDRAAQFAEENF